MKVLHVIPSLWRGDGGPSHALRAMERALRAQGVAVETATTDDAGPRARNGKSGQGPLAEEEVTRRYFTKRSDFYKWSPEFGRWISRAVRDYDLLHLHALFTYTTTAAAGAARRTGVPYIVRPLGTLGAWALEHRRPALKRWSLRAIEAPLLRDASAVHFTSELEQREAQALRLAMKPVVIPLGVEMPARSAPRMRRDSGPVRALYLSRLDAKKNLEGLLDALALIKDEWPALELAVAGDGSAAHVAALRAQAEAAGIAGRVRWLGHVEGEAKQRAWDEADFFVLASHSENFGIAAAEALAQGLPCILGRGVALADAVARAGAGAAIEPRPESIAAGLRLMIPPTARAAMSVRAGELARERYSIEAMGAQLKQLYTDILASRRGLPASR